jgi:hypothetical protein
MDNQQQKWASAGPTLNLIFSILSLIFAGMFLGFLNESAAFILGLIQIGVWPTYLIGSVIMLQSGDMVGGNTFLYFATFFGLVPGLVTVGTYFAQMYGWPFDPTTLGIMWLSVGLILTFTLPAFAQTPSLNFAVLACAGIAIDFIGLGYLNIVPPSISNIISGVLLAFVGIGGLYLSVAGILEGANIKIPVGKPLFKQPNSTNNLDL